MINNDQRNADAQELCILSIWAQVMIADPETGSISFEPINSFEPHKLIKFSPLPGTVIGTGLALAMNGRVEEWAICEGALNGTLSFCRNQKWIGAGKEGHLFFTDKNSTSESFMLISIADAETLRVMNGTQWLCLEESGLQSNFSLKHFSFRYERTIFLIGDNIPFKYIEGESGLCLTSDAGLQFNFVSAQKKKIPSIWLQPLGNIGNRALQYLTAEGIRQHIPNAEIQNIDLDMWGVTDPAQRPTNISAVGTGATQFSIDTYGLAQCLERQDIDCLMIESFTFCVGHYPSRERSREILPNLVLNADTRGFGPGQLLCNIRADEVLKGVHPNYLVLPPEYYELLAQESGLELVFYGQIDRNPYIEKLRARFPQSVFVKSQGAAVDFEVIRNSSNIAVSVSTFSWLAAWLSEAQSIYIPVAGMYHPLQQRGQDFITCEDIAYRYVSIPKVTSSNLYDNPEDFWRTQDFMGQFCHMTTDEELMGLRSIIRSQQVESKAMVACFSSQYYCNSYPEIGTEVLALETNALGHYLRNHLRKDKSFHFDEVAYAKATPNAVSDVFVGLYPNLRRHYQFCAREKDLSP